MPFITSTLLFRIPVETTDGRALGKVVGLEIDVDSQSVLRYQVRPRGFVGRVVGERDLLIHRGQVRAITQEKIIVESGALERAQEQAADTRMAHAESISSVHTSANIRE